MLGIVFTGRIRAIGARNAIGMATSVGSKPARPAKEIDSGIIRVAKTVVDVKTA